MNQRIYRICHDKFGKSFGFVVISGGNHLTTLIEETIVGMIRNINGTSETLQSYRDVTQK
jgi:hypothetical protein